MSLSDKLSKIIERYEDLNKRFLDPNSISSSEFAQIAKERSELEEIITLAKAYKHAENSIIDLKKEIKSNTLDQEFKEIMEQELSSQQDLIVELEEKIKIALLPKDKDDDKNAILEIRAGTGGEEAALFGSVLLRMYQRFAEKYKWKFEILSISNTGLDGCKEATASISGQSVFAKLKFESGVHRVQRVPETESSGRIHTSAATVAVLPEVEEVDVEIEEKDLRIDVFRASGAGGQHVNTTDSAVRITHLPTGIVVTQQDERSQHKNKARALKVLRAKIYEIEREKINSERSAMRKGQVGSGDRSERIRTYNYPQSRVTDHRVNITLYDLSKVVNEGHIEPFIEALTAEDEAARLAEHEV
jgi:peptide chain release factor 1